MVLRISAATYREFKEGLQVFWLRLMLLYDVQAELEGIGLKEEPLADQVG